MENFQPYAITAKVFVSTQATYSWRRTVLSPHHRTKKIRFTAGQTLWVISKCRGVWTRSDSEFRCPEMWEQDNPCPTFSASWAKYKERFDPRNLLCCEFFLSNNKQPLAVLVQSVLDELSRDIVCTTTELYSNMYVQYERRGRIYFISGNNWE
jgi:hypothetical protein